MIPCVYDNVLLLPFQRTTLHHARQSSDKNRLKDMAMRIMDRSDPLILDYFQKARPKKKKVSEYPKEVIDMCQPDALAEFLRADTLDAQEGVGLDVDNHEVDNHEVENIQELHNDDSIMDLNTALLAENDGGILNIEQNDLLNMFDFCTKSNVKLVRRQF